jgi:hypothetical protein
MDESVFELVLLITLSALLSGTAFIMGHVAETAILGGLASTIAVVAMGLYTA